MIRDRAKRLPPVVMDGALGAAIFAIGATQAVLYQRYYPRSDRPLALVLMSESRRPQHLRDAPRLSVDPLGRSALGLSRIAPRGTVPRAIWPIQAVTR